MPFIEKEKGTQFSWFAKNLRNYGVNPDLYDSKVWQ